MYWAFIQKRQSSLTPSTARLLYFFTNLRPAGRYLADLTKFFFAISGAPNFKRFKQLFMTLSGLGSLTMWEVPH